MPPHLRRQTDAAAGADDVGAGAANTNITMTHEALAGLLTSLQQSQNDFCERLLHEVRSSTLAAAEQYSLVGTAGNFARCMARYSGRPDESLENFLDAVLYYKECMSMSDASALRGMSILLADAAAVWWQGVKTSTGTWTEALTRIRGAFGENRPPYQLYEALYKMKQGDMKTDLFISHVMALFAKLPPGDLSEKVQLDMAFALLDPSLKKRVNRKSINNFDELLRQCRAIEDAVQEGDYTPAAPTPAPPPRPQQPVQQQPQPRRVEAATVPPLLLSGGENKKTQLAEEREVQFTKTLTEPLGIGSHIVCTGTPTEDSPWFELNIGRGDVGTGRADVAVHFNVRMPQCIVVRNTRRNNQWGYEEITASRSFPFKLNRPFTIEAVVDKKETIWVVDGEPYCRFTHRNPNPLLAEWVQVKGVRDATLTIQKTDLFPSLAPPHVETQLAEEREVQFTKTLTESLGIGSHIVCTGTPTEDLPWFELNIGRGDVGTGRADVAVHFNVRMPKCIVVRNTRRNNQWGYEETTASRSFPFKLNRPFTIEAVVDKKETIWVVDGEPYCRFTHRNPSPLLAEWVQVKGVRDATLIIQKTDLFPSLAPPHVETQLAELWEVQFTQTLTEPLGIGSHIVCTGTPTVDLPWFELNIGRGDVGTGRADIAVHFNVRMPQLIVVRNTRRNNQWGYEEITASRSFPFKLNRPFTIEALVDEKETIWAVDGEPYCSFAHRNPSPLRAGWVQVKGVRDATLIIQKTDLFPSLAPPHGKNNRVAAADELIQFSTRYNQMS